MAASSSAHALDLSILFELVCDAHSSAGGSFHARKKMLRPKRFSYDSSDSSRLTHYLFRYPAKFHPPVARALIDQFTCPGNLILDPFCGSGTLLVEALPLGRKVIGLDIDPVATFVSKVKTMKVSSSRLRQSIAQLEARLAPLERSSADYEAFMFQDLSESAFVNEINRHGLNIPEIPNISHWFRNYVIVDLGLIRREIETITLPKLHIEFLRLCFGSIIRQSSNADPVPVSGLEVTSEMLRREKEGREINPFKLFKKAMSRSAVDCSEFQERLGSDPFHVKVKLGDATKIRKHIRKPVDVVITSPPYHNAVDYYRRHTLEMYWLGFARCREDRLALKPKYIGQHRIRKSHPLVLNTSIDSDLAKRWEKKLAAENMQRAIDFKHYVGAMTQCVRGLSTVLEKDSLAIFVIGKNSWNGIEIPTVELFNEIACEKFKLSEYYWYPIKNRYMTYTRHNNANIDKEFVLVYKRT